MTSQIAWCDETWEVTAGCTKLSPGCLNCYAARLSATRLKHHPDCKGLAFPRYRQSDSSDGIRSEIVPGEYNWTGEVRLLPHNLDKPLHWRKPRRIFVDSRSDLFHESVPDEYIDKVFAVALACAVLTNHRHTFLMLTKRADRMRSYLASRTPSEHLRAWAKAGNKLVHLDNEDVLFSEHIQSLTCHDWDDEGRNSGGSQYRPWGYTSCLFPLPNLRLGVTAENQEQADARIPHLLATPAAIRFVSVEPMLGPVDLTRVCSKLSSRSFVIGTVLGSDGRHFTPGGAKGVGLNWIICGGQSGPNARPMHPDWARSLRDQCVSAGVPFFFKQWGEWAPHWESTDKLLADMVWLHSNGVNSQRYQIGDEGGPDHALMRRVGKAAAGNMLDGRAWQEYPEAAR